MLEYFDGKLGQECLQGRQQHLRYQELNTISLERVNLAKTLHSQFLERTTHVLGPIRAEK